jgi:hypothetical protein
MEQAGHCTEPTDKFSRACKSADKTVYIPAPARPMIKPIFNRLASHFAALPSCNYVPARPNSYNAQAVRLAEALRE